MVEYLVSSFKLMKRAVRERVAGLFPFYKHLQMSKMCVTNVCICVYENLEMRGVKYTESEVT